MQDQAPHPEEGDEPRYGIHVPLETFLTRLSDDVAGEARATAGRIDELDRSVRHLDGIELRYLPWAFAAILLFIASGFLLLSDGEIFRTVRSIVGPIGMIGMAGALPVLGIVYSLKVRGRTRADTQKFELNRTAFVPHGGIYFPPKDGKEGTVYLVDPKKESMPKRRDEDIRAGRLW